MVPRPTSTKSSASGPGSTAELLTHMVTEVNGIIGLKQSAEDLKLVTDLLVGIGDKGVVFSATDALMYPSSPLGSTALFRQS